MRLLLLLLSFSIVSCSPMVSTNITETYPAQPEDEPIVIIGLEEVVPKDSKIIGKITISDTGFSVRCGWDVVIELAKVEVRNAGGNGLHIIQHVPPNFFGGSCHQITAEIIWLENAKSYTPEPKPSTPSGSIKEDLNKDRQ